jgi:hypothetical protein
LDAANSGQATVQICSHISKMHASAFQVAIPDLPIVGAHVGRDR